MRRRDVIGKRIIDLVNERIPKDVTGHAETKGDMMRDYSQAIYIAQQNGVRFDKDFHAQDIGGYMAELARDFGYRKPKNANGSTGRYFFQLLQRRRERD